MVFVFGIIFVILFQFVTNQTDANKYGPYKLDWGKITLCRGPKPVNCGNLQLERSNDPTDLLLQTNMPKDCQIMTAKIEASTLQNNTTKKLWHSVLNKPCQHFVLGPVLTKAFNLTSSCKITMGSYTTHINAGQIMKTFLGSGFFYGSYLFKTTGFNKASNVFCIQATMNVLRLP